MRVLVLIPCYNEEENIRGVVEDLKRYAPEVDFLVINDCSTDQSACILQDNSYPHLNLPANLGIGGAMQSGYVYAVEQGYDIAVQMDGDGQHDPKFLPDILRPVMEGECDLCIGSRFITKEGFQTSFFRRLGIQFLSFLIYLLCGKKVLDTTSGFRASSKELTELYAQHYAQDYPEPEAIISAVMNGFRVKEVPVVMAERKGGVSSIAGPVASAYYMVKVTLSLITYRFSIRRLRHLMRR